MSVRRDPGPLDLSTQLGGGDPSGDGMWGRDLSPHDDTNSYSVFQTPNSAARIPDPALLWPLSIIYFAYFLHWSWGRLTLQKPWFAQGFQRFGRGSVGHGLVYHCAGLV